jgi:hypothetical protein
MELDETYKGWAKMPKPGPAPIKPKPPGNYLTKTGSFHRFCNGCHVIIPNDSYSGLCPKCQETDQ